jgi:hypothetical protein
MLLETPKTKARRPTLVAIDPLDERNLSTLRGLMNGAGEAGGSGR